MGKNTKIEWVANPETLEAGRTWNPTTGCDKISKGCDNCYALSLSKQLKADGAKRYQNDGNPITSGPGFDLTLHNDLVNQPRFWKEPTTVFVNSMSDLMHARVPLDFLKDIFTTMRETPQHTYQVLTKRSARLPKIVDKLDWPDNLWMGTSVEDEEAMFRIEHLLVVPTKVRFLSCEPLLGPLPGLENRLDGIDWVIAGGESGVIHRPVELDWLRGIRDATRATNTALFFKQWGGLKPTSGGKELDGETFTEMPKV
jgi:protein gp37